MSYQCWQCGRPLEGLILPVSRRETCRACDAEIHVCRMCAHFRPNRSQACVEDRAEDVANRELANFCDWYAPVPDAFDRAQAKADDGAKAALAALFGDRDGDGKSDAAGSGDPDRDALNDLFRKPEDGD